MIRRVEIRVPFSLLDDDFQFDVEGSEGWEAFQIENQGLVEDPEDAASALVQYAVWFRRVEGGGWSRMPEARIGSFPTWGGRESLP